MEGTVLIWCEPLASVSGLGGCAENENVEISNGIPKVEVSSLMKRYHAKKAAAVDNLDLSMFESEIFCLLGHNGAGMVFDDCNNRILHVYTYTCILNDIFFEQ